MNANKAKSIFLHAVEQLSADQWPNYLSEACGDDSDLRRSVEALLAAHRDNDDLADQARQACAEALPTVDHSTSGQPGTMIGPYKLLEEIAEGGMGTVWVAQQTKPVQRKVAIKLIKPGMDSRQVLARFEAERQALAMMDHPNIARVIDGGMTDQGRPYFAMEYVKGVPLIEYCDNARLSVKKRLELFIPICKAVQHAHQKGVIHRDLKPSNILVCLYDGKPVPKVIDFGLAKAMHQSLTEKTLYTAHGMMVGTPLYMSPEQAESNNLDVDTRTDIYSLGVILYELLTGSTPLEKAQLKDAAVNEILRLIKEFEPPKPSTRVNASQPNVAEQRSIETEQLTRNFRGDLDWVVMKALEKERSRRYETANGLAEDIRRHLWDEPVSASPPSTTYRMGKFIKRNRVAVVAGSLVAVALLLAVAGTSAGMFWALNEREEAREQRARAEQREQEAIDAVRRFGDSVANNPELKNRPELASLRKTLLQEPLAYFQSFSEQLQKDSDAGPESLAQLAQAAFDLAVLTKEIGSQQDAMTAYQQTLAILEPLVQDYPTVAEYQNRLAKTHNNIGRLLRESGQQQEALAAFRRALAIRQRLVRDHPGDVEFRYDLAIHLHNIALMLNDTGQPEEALPTYQQSLEIREKLAKLNPDVADFQHELATVLHNIGNLQLNNGDLEEAMSANQRALAIRKRLVRNHPEHPEIAAYQRGLAISYGGVGSHLAAIGQVEEARENYQQALAIRQRLVREHPSVTEYQSELSDSHHNIGLLLHHKFGQSDEALASLRQSLKILERLVEIHPIVIEYQDRLAGSYHNLGHLLGQTGKTEEGLTVFRKALAIRQRLAQDHPEAVDYQGKLAGCHTDIGRLLAMTGQRDDALAGYQFALEIREQLARDYPRNARFQSSLGGLLNNMAMLDLFAQKFSDACTKLIRSIEYQNKALVLNPKNSVFRRFLDNHYRLFFVAIKGLGEAERWNEAAAFGQQLIDQNPEDALVWLRIAPLFVLDGDPNDYAKFCERMVEHFADTEDPTIADKVCKACLLTPEAIDIAELPGELLNDAFDSAPDWFPAWGWGTRALLAYRSGDAESAHTCAGKSEDRNPAGFAHALNLAVLAMAKKQLGDEDAAERALNNLSQIIDEKSFSLENYHDLLIAKILHKEAEAKINDSSN